MNFLNLYYFYIAAQELNFTQAAKRLHISQQSLSGHIAKLERHFGAELFDRNPPMTLTESGRSLMQNAHNLLELKKQAESEVLDIQDFRNGSLTIGITHARGTVLLPELLPPFHQLFPNIRLHVLEGTTQEVEDALRQSKVDVSIGFSSNDSAIVSEKLVDEYSVIVVPHAIFEDYFPANSTQRRRLLESPSFEAFRTCPFVTINKNTWAGSIFENCCRDKNIWPHVLMEVRNVATLVALCRRGMGVMVCPSIFVQDQNELLDQKHPQKMHVYPLDYEPAHRSISINYLKNKYLTQGAKEFIELAKSIMRP